MQQSLRHHRALFSEVLIESEFQMQSGETQGNRLSVLQVFVPVLVGLFGMLLQSLTYLNHDVAWVLYSSGWLLDGKTFGVDIVAANPPFIWWFSEIPMWLSRVSGIDPIVTFRILIACLITVSLAATNAVFRESGLSARARFLFLAISAYVFTIGVHRDFGQREFLTVLLLLPYLAAASLRLGGKRPGWLAALAMGLAAGFGVCLKPYFLAVVLPAELVLIWKGRSLKSVIRPEALGAVVAAFLCLTGLIVFAWPWVSEVLPEISRTYWGFDQSLSAILNKYFLLLAIVAASVLAIWRNAGPYEAYLLAAASVGFAISAVLQAKGYSYHFYPVLACILLALALSVPRNEGLRSPTVIIFLVAVAYSLGMSLAGIYKRSDLGRDGREIGEMVEFVRSNVPAGGSFIAIGTHPFPGFPTALYAARDWQSASNSGIFLPSVVRLNSEPAAGALGYSKRKSIDAKLRDFGGEPDIVLVDIRKYRHAINDDPFDYLEFFLGDPDFRKLWMDYEPTDDAPKGFAAYRRIERTQ